MGKTGRRRRWTLYVGAGGIHGTTKILDAEHTIEREFKSLLKIKDQYPKYVLSLDTFFRKNYEGVRYMPLGEFLLYV
jgi:predicted AAA+ superfamily ATPase